MKTVKQKVVKPKKILSYQEEIQDKIKKKNETQES